MKEPRKEDYGYESPSIESQGGWCIEGGEEAYNSALAQWKTKYTYYKIEFEDCGLEYDYTIVENLSDINDYLQAADTALDDPDSKSKVIITGIGMTRAEYHEWFKKTVKP